MHQFNEDVAWERWWCKEVIVERVRADHFLNSIFAFKLETLGLSPTILLTFFIFEALGEFPS